VNCDILGTYRNVTSDFEKELSVRNVLRPVVFISSVGGNNSKDAANRKTSNGVIRKWRQNYLIYVQHQQFHELSITCNYFIVCLTLRSYNIPHKSLVLSLSSH
jgi:hypothetical protein